MAIEYRGETFPDYNKPKLLRNHPKYKAAVLARQDGKVKKIMFGDANAGHNFSAEAREAFKSRFASLLKKYKNDKFSRIYWADKFLWNPKGIKREYKSFVEYVKPEGINIDSDIDPTWAKLNLKNTCIQGGLDPKIKTLLFIKIYFLAALYY